MSRQYTGTAGKVTNCQVGVSLHLASDTASAAVDWRLFLPGNWDPASPQADPAKTARRERYGIPPSRGGQPEGYCHRQMMDAVRCVVDNGDNGIKWRAMPADLPAWDRVYAFARRSRAGPAGRVPRPAARPGPRGRRP